MKMTGNTMLITGGGSGIGRELAQRFHDLGNRVIVAGRTPTSLEETIAGRDNMHAMPLDIADATAIDAFVTEATRCFPGINVLVNNAGMMVREILSEPSDPAAAERTFITNLLGPIRLTNALVGHLLAQDDAAVINTTSGLAFVPLVAAPSYSASKAALHSWTVSLREQLRGRADVIELAPPAVRTELTPGQSTREGYMPLDDYMDEVMDLFGQQPTPEEILVKNVHFLRFAERNGQMDAALMALGAL